MDSLEKLREVAIEAVSHVAMANYASRENEAYKMINDCVDSLSSCAVVSQSKAVNDKVCSCDLLTEITNTLENYIGDSDPTRLKDGEDPLTDEELQHEFPVIWCFQKLEEIRQQTG